MTTATKIEIKDGNTEDRYKHLEGFTKKELIEIIKDCDVAVANCEEKLAELAKKIAGKL